MIEESSESEKGLATVNPNYLKLLKESINEIFPGWTQLEIAQEIKIGLNSFNSLVSSGMATRKTLGMISKTLGVIEYEDYKKRLPIVKMIEERFVSNPVWVSYRFDRDRRLYQSIWTFEKVYIEENVPKSSKSKKTDKGQLKNRIQKIRVVKRSHEDILKGELWVNPDLSVTMKIQSEDGIFVDYRTVFEEREYSEDWKNNFNFIVFEALFLLKKRRYSSLELLAIIDSQEKYTPSLLSKTRIFMNKNEFGIPKSLPYLAFNYLTRAGSKSRRRFENFELNVVRDKGCIMSYRHTVFISTPISFLKGSDKEAAMNFSSFQSILTRTRDNLEKYHGFAQSDIHCELLGYGSFDRIPLYDRHGFFQERNLISSTHHIAIIPERLGSQGSSVYFHIYFRILKKLPSTIYIEKRSVLPYFLSEVLDTPDRPINISVIDCSVESIPERIETAGEKLFHMSF